VAYGEPSSTDVVLWTRTAAEAVLGDAPTTDGELRGQRQAGVDPIGVESNFPGLVASSVMSEGGQDGVVEPAAFVSFNTFPTPFCPFRTIS
jgi:hypothetical protein